MRHGLKKLGPGLLYAGAAIGVSHLVQSTRSGSEFGWVLWWAIVLANLAKLPFFEIGPRYAIATGTSLLDGYKKLGNWAIGLFAGLTLLTMFTIQSAVTIVTASLATEIFGPWFGPGLLGIQYWCAALLLLCLGILGFGHYHVLDKLIKWVIIILSITTLIAFVTALVGTIEHPTVSHARLVRFDISNRAHLLLLIGLMGWMPAPVDIAAWHSLWTLAKQRLLSSKDKLTMADSRFDFFVGYGMSAVLALVFFGLGVLTIYASGETLSSKGTVFAKQVVMIYTRQLGDWTYPIIAIAAFTTMFSTTLTCLDAFPRILRRTTLLLAPKVFKTHADHRLYWFWIVFTVIGTFIFLFRFVDNMGQMVTLATVLSFLTTPLLALMNYLVMLDKDIPKPARLSPLMKIWSIAGLICLTGFAIYFLWVRFFMP